tara:strand:- start:1561 stop:1788 length:228 start_codon:yes stop_codon:yes gene_type:complete
MYKLITEATIIGLIILILGKISIKLTINKKREEYPKGINLSLFVTGFILHFVIEFIGINCWYCDKKCATQICNFN